MDPAADFTRILQQARGGDSASEAHLFALAYDQLRASARRVSAGHGVHTLQPTALVHEAWLKLAPGLQGVGGRLHFFAVASMAMRQVLADYARATRRDKRGGGRERVTLEESRIEAPAADIDLCALDESLGQLAELNPRHARVVELRVFSGMTIEEVAETLGVSHCTVESDWNMARAWLGRKLAHES